ncbi:MAG: hypothetical protein R3E39_21605 [Anaerolineae bacterium]
MYRAALRFHGELNFFLPRARKNVWIEHHFDGRVSVKDMVESLGIPHPEIEVITANSHSVDFNYMVQSGDTLEVYGSPNGKGDESPIELRPAYPGRPAFILDQHLGRLAAYLRMMGF